MRVEFPFHDAEFLRRGESTGGLAYVPDQVENGTRAPLVVFLHGVNREAVLHRWLGGRGSPDLTALAASMGRAMGTRPFILAGPSQTRAATAGRTMWRDFDLGDFVDAVDASLAGRAEVARSAIIVAGHSGAGCNPEGGLLRAALHPGDVTPLAIVAIDTCLDADSGRALGAAPPALPLFVRWERVVWPRPMALFLDSYQTAAQVSGRDPLLIAEMTDFHARPHDEIVERTLAELLPQLLALPETEP